MHGTRSRREPVARPEQRRIVFLLIWLSSLCIAAQRPGFAAEPPANRSLEEYLKTLRYEPVAYKTGSINNMLVEGRLGGKKREFLLDTGWGMTTVGEASAHGFKTLGELGSVLEDSYLGPLTDPKLVLLDKLVLGHAQFLNQPARVEKLQIDYIPVGFDGILGLDFFFRNFCLMDCGSRRLFVRATKRSGQESAALEETLRRSGFIEVPTQWRNGLTVEAEINGHGVCLLVDTGASFSLLDASELARLSLSLVKEDHPAPGTLIPGDVSGNVVGVGKIGAHTLKVTKVKLVRIGAKELKEVHFGVTSLASWKLAAHDDRAKEINGLLGADLLINNDGLIDFANRKLWLLEKATRPR